MLYSVPDKVSFERRQKSSQTITTIFLRESNHEISNCIPPTTPPPNEEIGIYRKGTVTDGRFLYQIFDPFPRHLHIFIEAGAGEKGVLDRWHRTRCSMSALVVLGVSAWFKVSFYKYRKSHRREIPNTLDLKEFIRPFPSHSSPIPELHTVVRFCKCKIAGSSQDTTRF